MRLNTSAAFATVENEIPSVSNLVKKTDENYWNWKGNYWP